MRTAADAGVSDLHPDVVEHAMDLGVPSRLRGACGSFHLNPRTCTCCDRRRMVSQQQSVVTGTNTSETGPEAAIRGLTGHHLRTARGAQHRILMAAGADPGLISLAALRSGTVSRLEWHDLVHSAFCGRKHASRGWRCHSPCHRLTRSAGAPMRTNTLAVHGALHARNAPHAQPSARSG